MRDAYALNKLLESLSQKVHTLHAEKQLVTAVDAVGPEPAETSASTGIEPSPALGAGSPPPTPRAGAG